MSIPPNYGLLLRTLLHRRLRSLRQPWLKRQLGARWVHIDGRSRLSSFWTPTGGIAPQSAEEDGSHSLLIRGGFLRQASSGVFHLLPLGLRVQEKLERLVDKHMRSLGASKVSLSSISSEELWQRSGRLSGGSSELLRLKDRKDSGYLLSPTHEEEITMLTAGIVKSYKELPLRLYQITRKYRDELRPRQGLLRAKEFLMKDLYTFDLTTETALGTYESVREAYRAFFDELKIPYLVADADSGAIGGNLSHEYHFISPKGEDNVCQCTQCNYVANEELAEKQLDLSASHTVREPDRCNIWTGVSRDRRTLVEVYWPLDEVPPDGESSTSTTSEPLNLHLVKSVVPDLDSSVDRDAYDLWKGVDENSNGIEARQILRIFDYRIWPGCGGRLSDNDTDIPRRTVTTHPTTGKPLDLTRIQTGDSCPHCEVGKLQVHRAIEVGHTFHLGTRYSEPLNAVVAAHDSSADQITMQMGCHGIGISRMIGAVASVLADPTGLSWPRVIAPFEVVVVPSKGMEQDAVDVYDRLREGSQSSSNPAGRVEAVDVLLDDRDKPMTWKLNDADLIGYPVIVVLGRAWKKERKCEVQCRRLDKLREEVAVDRLAEFVRSLLERL